jgi:hypothetical protein
MQQRGSRKLFLELLEEVKAKGDKSWVELMQNMYSQRRICARTNERLLWLFREGPWMRPVLKMLPCSQELVIFFFLTFQYFKDAKPIHLGSSLQGTIDMTKDAAQAGVIHALVIIPGIQ